tara:strand:- start:36 stop:998 length:963 start_codon:yes stop_codon:yes gene_type:complete
MNNYSFLQQILHKIALSSQFMREITFDLENSLIKSKIFKDNHVFVSGLARSGTTILLNAIHKSNKFGSLSYEDMPFILAPNLWYKISSISKKSKSIERAHGDGIFVSSKSPEAFEEVYWKTFNDKSTVSIQNFKLFINNIILKNKKKRYLSKNNQNINRIKLLSKSFSHSVIFIPFRLPLQHSNSLLFQHIKFRNESKSDNFISEYMKIIGHTEFGPNYLPLVSNYKEKNHLELNHWLEQWYLTYKNLHDNIKNLKNVNFVCYEELCKSKIVWEEISKKININHFKFDFRLSLKEINLKYDKKLLSKCDLLYDQLKKISI